MGSLEEAVVVITGAGRGIGRAIAEELGRGGAKVVVNYSQSKAPAEDLVAQLQEIRSAEVGLPNPLLELCFENNSPLLLLHLFPALLLWRVLCLFLRL